MDDWRKEFQYLLDRKILSRDELAYLFGQIKSIVGRETKQLEVENKQLREVLESPDIEKISEAVHKSYCKQYKIKHSKEYWTGGNYSKLDEATKEFDRATVRAVLQALKGKTQ